ncbi:MULTISPECIES: preprotein translocase subunit SecE [unclassified Polynucleobacter]|jgi:preprotein translocase subunit SecE|uniref:preprotein translocase subunit SecE n=1 Tax=unclassified Polynucleobacter TaxID=2640945 RepID=UPI0025722190|nr:MULTISPECIES: preprotein translocase subunit SecE [unclassified Polynucleobacter]BEI34511.1 preprotein translocase subunit SecE [Polynucleobacter sp. HIN6]BEI36305.1 preprotein translocase subunit SecE [Polynucleobacter sp. HIN7]BEI40098.1 preprotein translocase subunit SecE [Polynucleobacter sp. HIN9]BEI41880.1 preprotein translocase subunit SecE [Polynucleobacter sp. HIN10]BEI43657.1 preprotein translocase subunit SecE [Polynucleobacter sp. HIN11]
MSQQTIDSSEQKSGWVSLVAVAIVIAALVLYYTLIDQGYWVRLAALLGGIALAVILMAFSADGKRFIAYSKDSWLEVKKVVWPTRQESTRMTLVVFGFVLIMALFLWLIDKLVEWLVFSIFLGWK